MSITSRRLAKQIIEDLDTLTEMEVAVYKAIDHSDNAYAALCESPANVGQAKAEIKQLQDTLLKYRLSDEDMDKALQEIGGL